MLKALAETLLKEPDTGLLNDIAFMAENFGRALGNDAGGAIMEASAGLKKALSRFSSAAVSEARLAIAKETAGLFYTGRYSIGVTASFYLSPVHVNKQAQWEAALKFYSGCGFRAKHSDNDEDSAGVMLMFSSALCSCQESASCTEELIKYAGIQKDFYRNHLAPWFHLFASALYENAPKNGVFKPLAVILYEYVSADMKLLRGV